jgi:hypothetical protein
VRGSRATGCVRQLEVIEREAKVAAAEADDERRRAVHADAEAAEKTRRVTDMIDRREKEMAEETAARRAANAARESL